MAISETEAIATLSQHLFSVHDRPDSKLSSKNAKAIKQDHFLWGTLMYWVGRNANSLLQCHKYSVLGLPSTEAQERNSFKSFIYGASN